MNGHKLGKIQQQNFVDGVGYLAFGNSAPKMWFTWCFTRFLSLSSARNYLRFSVRYMVFLWSVLDLPHLYV